MIRVAIVDDHPVVRAGIRQTIAGHADMKVTAEAATAREALAQIHKGHFDILILDISLPDTSGLELLGQVKDARPDLPVLILSIHSEEQYAIRALKAGATGYLNKDSAADELVEAVRRVASGGRYIGTRLAEQLAVHLAQKDVPPHELLSDREYIVTRKLAEGRTVSDIARDLDISVKTVSTYRARSLRKLNADNNAQLIRYAVAHELVE